MRWSFFFLGLMATSSAFAQVPTAAPLRTIDRTHAPFDAVDVPATVAPPPQPLFDVRKYGAVGDSVTFDTAAIQKAIDACAGTGGSVVLSGGKFLTAPLVLKGGMTFYIAKDAALLGSTRPQDYPHRMPPQTAATALRKSLLYAYGADHLTLDGEGEINGQGQLLPMGGKEPYRPSLLRIFGSTNVTVRNLTLRNPRMWTQIYSECSHVTIDHETVDSPRGYCENLDGMDICDCDHVVVSSCHIQAQDDGICLKSHGPRGLQDITLRDNRILDYDANAIKLGTATNGPISHLLIENNRIDGARFGGLCLESVDGSAVSDVTVNGLDMSHVSQPIYIRLSHRKPLPGDIQFTETAPRPAGSIDGVVIENVRVLNPNSATKPSNTITGIPNARLGSIVIRNAFIEMPGGVTAAPHVPGERDGQYPQSSQFGLVPGYAFYVRHAASVTFDHVTVQAMKPDVRPWLVKEDAAVTAVKCQSSSST
jgi:polygalacturonase